MTTEPAEQLREALRRKGIGPKGSKKLPPELMQSVLPLLHQKETNRTTAAAFWTACLLLDNSEEEEQLLTPVREHPERFLLPELQALTSLQPDLGFPPEFLKIIHTLIQKKDLSLSEAQEAMEFFWNEATPEWMKGAFLQAARIKRESFEENFAYFESLWSHSKRAKVDFPYLLDLCDSYDGTNRSYHLSPFVANVLGAMGFPTIVHGVESLGPKYGITTAQILKHVGKSTTLSLEQAKTNLANPDIQWCYIDQSVSFPELFDLRQLRHDMVKRPFLATFDKLLQPLHNRKGNILFTGYVHAHYREEVVKLMSLHNQSQQVFNLRTIEGSTNCWGKKPTPFIGYRKNHGDFSQEKTFPSSILTNLPADEFLSAQGKELVEGEILPTDFGLLREDHQLIKGITTEQIAQEGLSALQGEAGLIHDLLVFQAAALLWLSGLIQDKQEAVMRVTEVIQSRKAWKHWQNQS